VAFFLNFEDTEDSVNPLWQYADFH